MRIPNLGNEFCIPKFNYQNVYQFTKEIRQPFKLKVVYDASCICDHQNLGKSIRQVLQTIIIDVVVQNHHFTSPNIFSSFTKRY